MDRDRDRARFEEVGRQTLTISNVKEIDLSNISGDVVILPGGGRDASIEYTKRGRGDTVEEAKRQLGLVEVSLNVTGDGHGAIRTHYRHGDAPIAAPLEMPLPGPAPQRRFRSSVDFRITTPPQTRIHVKTISGGIQVSKMKGDIALEAVSGDIRIDGGGRVSLAKTISGDIDISGIAAEEPLVASSMSGTVTLRGLKARYLDVSSVSGDVVIKDVTCDRAELQTLSGDLEYAGQLARSGRYELKAHSGDIRLAISGDVGFDVDANTFSGKIRSDLPIKNEAAEEQDSEIVAGGTRVRLPKRASFRGTYKDGSATIELTTFSGNIVITK